MESLIYNIYQESLFFRVKLEDTNKNKNFGIASKQDEPIKDIYNNVKILDEDITLQEFVLNTLAMGPNHLVLDKYNAKEILFEVDSLLE